MKRAALFVGVNEYQAPIASLNYARHDATSLYEFFVRSRSYRANMVDILSTEVTAEKILRAIKSTMAKLEPGDLFLFYFSGHGVEDNNQHLLLSSNAEHLGDSWTGAVSLGNLKHLTHKRGVQSVFIIDSCRDSLFQGHRGVAVGASAQARSVCLSAMVKEPCEEGYLTPVVLCSCSAGEQAFEVPSLEQGIFSRALLEAIETEPSQPLHEVAEGLVPRISKLLAAHRLTGKQTPELHRALGSKVHLFDGQTAAEPVAAAQAESPLVALILAAEKGSATAQYHLAEMYAQGDGVRKDPVEALKWTRMAAEQAHAAAQYRLARCYAEGIGVMKDVATAAQWYRKAAEQGYAKAQDMLGYCYDNGQGVVKNKPEALQWYRKAAEQGCVRSQNTLGYCYEFGQGVPMNCTVALQWYRKAAEQKDAYATAAIARLQKKGFR